MYAHTWDIQAARIPQFWPFLGALHLQETVPEYWGAGG